ncbi:MAG TPA: biliverdin-producing heme oxygenase [Phycisphaerae bacterium]|nr:biliverdin-producing heme oxygenase [Phycisphaerae bacterium]
MNGTTNNLIANDATPTNDVMERLRTATQSAHAAAEAHPLQAALASGALPRGQYVAYLGQLLHVHRTLERCLRVLVAQRPELAAVITDEQLQEPHLRTDLAHFGADADQLPPAPATAALQARIEHAARETPISLLGCHYVLEGSKNGGRFIAKRIAPAYGLTAEGPGLRYFDPHGAAQRDKWRAFREAMSALPLQEQEKSQMTGAAVEMFAAIAAIGDDVLAGRSVGSGPAAARGCPLRHESHSTSACTA